MSFLFHFLLLLLLFQISYVDYKTYIIPLKYNLCLGLLAVVRMIYFEMHPASFVAAAILMGSFLGSFCYLSKGEMLGGGDVKLMMAAGLLLGVRKVFFALLISCMLASLLEGIRIKRGSKNRIFAMGPYLCIGIFCQIIA